MANSKQPGNEKPVPGDFATWNAYWTARGMPWRTEPEINKIRQRFLAERQAVPPDIERSAYPFKGTKLDRADVEWLLAHLEDGQARGPVNVRDEEQQERRGLDVRGAVLAGANLSNLPLARLEGGLLSRRLRIVGHSGRSSLPSHAGRRRDGPWPQL